MSSRVRTITSLRAKVNPDNKSLIYLVVGILIFGLLMIYNSTAVYSFDLFGGAYRFVILQLVWVLLGLAGFWFFYNLDYHLLEKFALPVFISSLVFLVFVAFAGLLPCDFNVPFTPCLNGANRWFYFNPSPLPKLPFLGVLGFQPSEFAKLALVIIMSSVFSKVSPSNQSDIKWFVRYLLYCGSIVFLIMLQPNMSTSILTLAVGTVIYFVSRATLKPLLLSSPLVILIAIGAVLLSPYRRARLLGYVSEDTTNLEGAGYHVKQILIALGSGGFWGLGFGQSRQKYQYLPEVSADSIFAIIGEELGFIGTFLVVTIFLILFYKGYKIAANSLDLFGKLLSIGIVSWIGFQFCVNVAAMTKLIPLTGVPLPLISYGGSSTLFILSALGILGSVERSRRI